MSIKKHVDLDTLANVISAIPSNIFLKDTDLKYIFSSHIWEQVDDGNDKDFDIYGKTDRDIRKDTANLDNVEKTDRAILETGVGTRYTIKSDVDGHTQYLELIKEPVRDNDGNIIGIVGLINDVTKVTEEISAIMEANVREAERVAAMKSDFLANMSHELRTPMNAVIGLAEVALRADLPDETRNYISQIKSSGDALLKIINDILDFSKIESGNMDIIPDDYDPVSMLHGISDIMKLKINEKNLEYIENISPNLPSRLYGDSMRIRQALTNLFSNAIKFTHDGHVKANVDYEKISENEIMLKISIEDTGIGIKEEDFDKLFTSFQQLDSKRNRNIEGTGLGLAITSNLVGLMGGKVSFTSKYGQGSTFTISIPQLVTDWTPVSAAEENNELLPTSQGGAHDFSFVAPDAKVLIVDDNDVNLAVADALLEPLKMQIKTVLSGKEAIELLEKEPFDLVFMDHMMPELDGVETTKIIRSSHPELEKMPIVALSANAAGNARELFLASGMNDFVPKPIEINLITSTLAKWLPADKIQKCSGINKQDSAEEKLVIGDLDVEAAISLIGSQKIYLSILEKYANAIKNKAEIIKNCEVSGDIKLYTIEVHSLKSSSKQIGAMELSAMAAELEACGNAEDISTIHEKTDALLEKYLSYHEVLMPLFNTDDDSDKPLIQKEQLLALLDKMQDAADELDMDQMEAVSDELNKYSYDESFITFKDSLIDAAAGMDIDSIEEIINNWKNNI